DTHRLIGLHEWGAASGIAENQDFSWPQRHPDSGGSRRMINAREDGQTLGFDLGFKLIDRFPWSEATENGRQSICQQRILRMQLIPKTLMTKLVSLESRSFPHKMATRLRNGMIPFAGNL